MQRVLIVHTPLRRGVHFTGRNDGTFLKNEAERFRLQPVFCNLKYILADKIFWCNRQHQFATEVLERVSYGSVPFVWFSGRGCCELTRIFLSVAYESGSFIENYAPKGSIVERLIQNIHAHHDMEIQNVVENKVLSFTPLI